MSRGAFRRRAALDVWSMNFGPSMTPMVDVVLVILIFFMASASFVGPEWFLRAALPVLARPAFDGGDLLQDGPRHRLLVDLVRPVGDSQRADRLLSISL